MPESEHIAFWRYRHPSQGYRGYHLSADPTACADLLRALAQAGAQGIDLVLAPLTDAILTVPNSRADPVGFTSLRIEVAPGSELPIRVEEKHPRCTVVLAGDGVGPFTEGLQDLANGGEGDVTIGPEGHEISFWHWPKRS
jgi:hypothetical protein